MAQKLTAVELPFTAPILPTKDERYDSALFIVERLKENYSALEIHVILKHMAELVDQAIDMNKEDAISQIPAMNGKGVATTVFGAIVSPMRGRSKWEYPEDDPELPLLERAVEVAKDHLKSRQTFLQKMKEEVADPKTGLIIRPAKAVSDGGVILKVELPS